MALDKWVVPRVKISRIHGVILRVFGLCLRLQRFELVVSLGLKRRCLVHLLILNRRNMTDLYLLRRLGRVLICHVRAHGLAYEHHSSFPIRHLIGDLCSHLRRRCDGGRLDVRNGAFSAYDSLRHVDVRDRHELSLAFLKDRVATALLACA